MPAFEVQARVTTVETRTYLVEAADPTEARRIVRAESEEYLVGEPEVERLHFVATNELDEMGIADIRRWARREAQSVGPERELPERCPNCRVLA